MLPLLITSTYMFYKSLFQKGIRGLAHGLLALIVSFESLVDVSFLSTGASKTVSVHEAPLNFSSSEKIKRDQVTFFGRKFGQSHVFQQFQNVSFDSDSCRYDIQRAREVALG